MKNRDEILAHEIRLNELAVEHAKARATAARCTANIHHKANSKVEYVGRRSVFVTPLADAVATVERIAAKVPFTYIQGEAQSTLARYTEAALKSKATGMAVTEHEAGYEGWTRFYLVPAGHIHRGTGCPSLRPTTEISWVPELSGLTEAEAVEAHGPAMCTKCFPSAPVEWQQKAKVARSKVTVTIADLEGN